MIVAGVLLVLVGVAVAWIARASSRDGPAGESGWWLRRLLQYGFLLVALFSAASGVTRVLAAAVPVGPRIAGSGASDLALGLSLTLVAAPIWTILWRVVRRRLAADAEERASTAWALYLTTAGAVSLIVAYVNLVRLVTWVLGAGDVQSRAPAAAVTWAAVWALHAWLLRRPAVAPVGPLADVPLLAGSAVGLVGLALGAGGGVAHGLRQLYHVLVGPMLVEASTGAALRRSLAVLVPGAVIWWWHWLRHASRVSRTTPWHAYVLLGGVLGGLLTAVAAAATALYMVLVWFVGEPETLRPAVHFLGLPNALAAGLVGAWVWAYHRAVLGEAGRRRRDEPRRAYEYLVAAVGLVAAAAGVAMAITAAIDALAPAPLAAADPFGRNTVAMAVTLLIVGAPLWWTFWRRLQPGAVAGDPVELGSLSRRAYLFLLFGVAGLTAAISAVVVLFVVLRDLLEGTLSATVLHDLRVAIALVLAAGAVSAYHWTVQRDDRDAGGVRHERPRRHVLLISAADDRLAGQIAERVGADVRVLRRLDVAGGDVDVDAVADAILASPHPRLVVTVDGAGAVLAIPYEPAGRRA